MLGAHGRRVRRLVADVTGVSDDSDIAYAFV